MKKPNTEDPMAEARKALTNMREAMAKMYDLDLSDESKTIEEAVEEQILSGEETTDGEKLSRFAEFLTDLAAKDAEEKLEALKGEGKNAPPEPESEPEPEQDSEPVQKQEQKQGMEIEGIDIKAAPPLLTKDALVLSLKIRTWGNWARVPESKIETDADKKRIKTRKKKLDCKEVAEIEAFVGGLRIWLYSRTVKGVLRPGLYLANRSQVVEINEWLKEQRDAFNTLVEKLIQSYEKRVEESKAALGSLFDESDYPSVEEVRSQYGIEWYWMDFSAMRPPESLLESAPEVYREEAEKAERRTTIVEKSVTKSLREDAAKVFRKLADALEPTTADGKKRRIHESTLNAVVEFMETFGPRNFGNDDQLAAVLGKASRLLNGVNIELVRKDDKLRSSLHEQFAEIAANVERLSIEATETMRAFAFDDV